MIDYDFFNNSTLLVTGGTGSFGNKFVKTILSNYNPKKIIIYSRDEYKQWEMSKKMEEYSKKIRFFLGDVRDRNRLKRAFESVDYVIHAAALKQVPLLEYNPTEAVQTNVIGTENVVNAAADLGVKKAVILSSDKAVNPINLYGATKLVAEKLFISGNAYVGGKTVFSAVRYGNVIGSRGSIIQFFINLKKEGIYEFPITDLNMTRFWISLDQSVEIVIKALMFSVGGEIFVPKIPSMRVIDLARAIEPKSTFKIIGIRPGEKMHETLISSDESRKVCAFNGCYVILPEFLFDSEINQYIKCSFVEDGFVFSSNTNGEWILEEDIKEIITNIYEK